MKSHWKIIFGVIVVFLVAWYIWETVKAVASGVEKTFGNIASAPFKSAAAIWQSVKDSVSGIFTSDASDDASNTNVPDLFPGLPSNQIPDAATPPGGKVATVFGQFGGFQNPFIFGY